MKNTKITGRPATPITWPSDSEFTVADIQEKFPNITSVTIQCRINKALKENVLQKAGTRRKHKTGREAITYKMVDMQTVSQQTANS